MARTRSPEFDNIQASIIEKTAALFASRGYAATSIGDIAAACNCSKSRLYHYFESKEAILSEMLTEHVDKLLERCRETLQRHEDPVERFHELIRLFLDVYAVSGNKHVVLLTCLQFLPEDKRKEIVEKQRALIATVRDILVRIRPDMPQDAQVTHADTMLFFGMINWTYTWYKPQGSIQPGELAERAVDIFLDGYRHIAAPKAKSAKRSGAR
ncbi:TetR/AcrR family transcriptional regulator [Rhodoligotrophos defluvii]|uniref:TetR/AcrR family transcriptional regulator n=1 Tax=Rhodoligotrophos defluvii TaxID=2561934 RepID=UPI0010CA0D4B|nr:TetR/AcrR family transcriptional regulator [Rhodoligotrophos defluvii]